MSELNASGQARKSAPQWVPWLGGIVVVVLYLGYYLANPSLPGNNPAYPLGWWGWFDQGKYIQSAQALWAHHFSPALNWFPLGYSLLAAPFIGMLPMHPFFFVDLAGLLIAYAAFQSFALRLAVARHWSAPLFILTAMADQRLARTWAVPWNTTASAALIWLAFAGTAAQLAAAAPAQDRWRLSRFFGLGVVFGAMPLVRPTDALITALCGGALLIAEFGRRRVRWQDAAALIAGGLIVLVPYGMLYLRIYGLHETAYVIQSGRLGFAFSEFPWKAYVLLIDPRPWFPSGVSLLARCPWIALGIAGVVPAVLQTSGAVRWSATLLAVAILAYCVVFFSYIDLLPSGLWMYANVHYFQWVFPGVGLFAFLLLRALRGSERRTAIVSLIVTLIVLSVRIEAVRVGNQSPARMVQFPGVSGRWGHIYFGNEVLRDARGTMTNIIQMRLLPDGEGVRAIALRRMFVGPVQWAPGGAPSPQAQTIVPKRWGERITFGYPLWLPPYSSGALPPHT